MVYRCNTCGRELDPIDIGFWMTEADLGTPGADDPHTWSCYDCYMESCVDHDS